VADLVVVAFVSDRTTKQVLQAAVNRKTPLTSIRNKPMEISSLALYPNPARDQLYVNLGARATTPGILEVFDLNGRMMMNMEVPPGTQIIRLDVQNLMRGMYVIHRIESGRVVSRSKFIKTE
jgi:hypothetical protein